MLTPHSTQLYSGCIEPKTGKRPQDVKNRVLQEAIIVLIPLSDTWNPRPWAALVLAGGPHCSVWVQCSVQLLAAVST